MPFPERVRSLFARPSEVFLCLRQDPEVLRPLICYLLITVVITGLWGMRVSSASVLEGVLEKVKGLDAAQLSQIMEHEKAIFVGLALIAKVLLALGIWLGLSLQVFLVSQLGENRPQRPLAVALSGMAYAQMILVPKYFTIAVMVLVKGVGTASIRSLCPTSLGYYMTVSSPLIARVASRVEFFNVIWIFFAFLVLRVTFQASLRLAMLGTVLVGGTILLAA
jgi:hypothetical protein